MQHHASSSPWGCFLSPAYIPKVTTGLAENNGSLLPGLWLQSPAGWTMRTGISCRIYPCIKYGTIFYLYLNREAVLWWGLTPCSSLYFTATSLASGADLTTVDRQWVLKEYPNQQTTWNIAETEKQEEMWSDWFDGVIVTWGVNLTVN